ncbi:RimJ/RimL family protein N-acetyltransferase [Thalassotalea piscium]|uniref:RimJ/RimL family protein N-acetyltransferase n=2 Tax=Thalassotalea piscium TaxID=1230533 RepID=A0A7X0NIY0_9GAMM|nr:RimJ/RimL family protein N-acetyltransferase [Thalassotalea piscium]
MNNDDADKLFQLDQDPAVMAFINGGKPSSRDQINTVLIPRMNAYRNAVKGWGLWQVNTIDTNEYIGWVLARPMHFFSDTPEIDNIELGWRFFQSTWGKGYASEAALNIIKQLSTNKEIKCFSAIADETNLASIGVMKKIGMSYIKTYRHIDPLFECDVVYYQVSNNYKT